MKNLKYYEPYSLVTDIAYSNEWLSTMMQLMKLAGNDLYQHSIYVALLTASLALYGTHEFLSESGISIYSLILGALVHDIGYIGIPCPVNRNLSPTEYSPLEKMAFDIHISSGLEQVQFHTKDQFIIDIVSMHHEFLNGSGFPLGLEGDAIPLHVRIITLANYLANQSYITPISDISSPQYLYHALQSLLTNKTLSPKYDVNMIQSILTFLSSRSSQSPAVSSLSLSPLVFECNT